MDFIPMRNPVAGLDDMAQLEADKQEYLRRQQLAQALIGSGYVPNSGRTGVLTSVLSALAGGMMQRKNNESVTDLMRRTFEQQSQAAAAKRQQDLEDEQRKVENAIKEATGKKRGELTAERDLGKREIAGGMFVNPFTGQAEAIPGYMDQQLALKRGEAQIAAANRAPREDKFADAQAQLARAVQQGLITQDEARKRMHDLALGSEGAPKSNSGEWQIVGSNRINKVTGEIEALRDEAGKPISEQSGNPRQISGTNQVRTAMLNYAEQLTGTPSATLAKMSPSELEKHINDKGGHVFQGPFLGAMGNSLGLNASLQPFAEAAAAGQALVNNPAGQVTESDIRGAARQMPNPTMPLHTQARVIRSLMEGGDASGISPSTNAGSGSGVNAPTNVGGIGSIITGRDGRKYRITGGDPKDPDVEPVP